MSAMRALWGSAITSAMFLASASTLLAAPSASAAIGDDCPLYEFCGYNSTAYSELVIYTSENRSWVGADRNDRISSVINKTACYVELYRDINYTKHIATIAPAHYTRVTIPVGGPFGGGLSVLQLVPTQVSFWGLDENVITSFRFVQCASSIPVFD